MAAGVDRTNGERRRYVSYLLRLWQTQQEGAMVWRASLESSRTGERQGFADLDALIAFLRQQTGTASDSSGDKSGPEDRDAGPMIP